MTQISTVEARDQFSTVINRAAFGKERVVLTRRGKEIAAVVPMEDVRILEELKDHPDLADTRSALAEAKKKRTVPRKKLKTYVYPPLFR